MRYSQNLEQDVVKAYFGNELGTLLDIGANDGKTLSNSLALIEYGWSAVLIEPAPIPFDKLCALHEGNLDVHCLRLAISNISGEVEFHSSGTHLNNGDTDLLSTMNQNDLIKWQSTTTFAPIKVMSNTFNQFLSISPIKKFDFITIDAEGYDELILKQIDLKEVGCRCLCIEHNGDVNLIDRYGSYCGKFGMKQIHINNENIIFAV